MVTRMTAYAYVPGTTCIYHSQNWLHGPHSGGEPAGGYKTGADLSSLWPTHSASVPTRTMGTRGL